MGLLQQIHSGRAQMPPRIMTYGIEGVGKSLLASQTPNPIFVQTEDGLGEIDCHKFPLARSLDDVLGALTELATLEETGVIELEMPYPPSVNHLWRRVGPRTLLSREGRVYRQRVGALLAAHGIQPLAGPLTVEIEMYPPDRRRRDIDNLQKCLLDALAHGGAYQDDSQILHLEIWKRQPLPPHGMAIVRIGSWENQA